MGKELEVKKLTGSGNYHTWQFAVKHLIDYKGYGSCIETEIDKASGLAVVIEKDAGKLRSCKALLGLCVKENIFTHISKCTTAIEIWTCLKALYEDSGLVRKIGILRAMISTKLEDADNMQTYVDSIITGANKLQGIGFAITDEWIGAILLAGLTDKYQPLIMAIEGTTDELKSDVIISKLLDLQPESNSRGSGFFSKKNGKTGKFSKNGNFGKNGSFGKSGNSDKGKNDQKPKCFNCGRTNHFARDCRDPKKDTQAGSSGSSKAAFSAMTCITPRSQKREWFIDSGGSQHMTHEAEIIADKETTDIENITCANNEQMKVLSMGRALLKLANNTRSQLIKIYISSQSNICVSHNLMRGSQIF